MRILQYNIWDGCHDAERNKQLKKFLIKESYDIIGFNELKYWNDVDFKKAMKACGYNHCAFLEMSSSLYSIGIASKTPIETVKTFDTEPFHHGLLHVKTAQLDFIVTHLSPFSAEHRERETAFIADYVPQIDGRVVVMGDMNTLSPLDKIHYDKMGIKEVLNASENSQRRHIKNGKINYQPMQNLLDAGLHDVGAFEEQLDYSMPTKVHPNFKDRLYVRIDYVLVNTKLLKKNPRAHIIRNKEVEMISDHYPIECQLDL